MVGLSSAFSREATVQKYRIVEKCQKIYNPKNAEMSNWATIRDYKTQNFMPRASRMNLECYLLLFCVTQGTELTFFKNLC